LEADRGRLGCCWICAAVLWSEEAFEADPPLDFDAEWQEDVSDYCVTVHCPAVGEFEMLWVGLEWQRVYDHAHPRSGLALVGSFGFTVALVRLASTVWQSLFPFRSPTGDFSRAAKSQWLGR
jgi:hypothetical protein